MRRREVLASLSGGLFLASHAALAQPTDRPRRIGILIEYAEADPEAQARLSAFREGLQALGWTDGRNVRIDHRFAAGDADRIRAFAAELAGLTPDIILGSGAPVTKALQQATRTVPIVFVQVGDPVGSGLVPSLGRPGGNVTGLTNFEYPIVGKWLEVLKEIAPRVTRLLMIQNPANFSWPGYLRAAEAAAASFGVALTPAGVRDQGEIGQAIAAFAREPNGGLMVLPDTTTGVHRELIVGLAAQHGLPAVYPFRFFVTAGGLICYGIDVPDVFRRSASYVDRILRGEKPGDLPVEAASKFELVVNLKIAKALGLAIPPSLLARVDEVIE